MSGGRSKSGRAGSRLTVLLLLIEVITSARMASGQNPPARSAQLVEADNLSAQVVRLYQEEKFDEALPLARRALKIREKALGADDRLLAAAMDNLAEIHLARKKPDDAEPLYRRALAIYEKTTSAKEPYVGRVLERLALIRSAKGDFGRAEDFYKRALAAKEQALGQESDEVLQSVRGLAEFYRARGEFDKAEVLLRRVVEAREKALGPTNPEVARLREKLACVLYRGGKEAEARKEEARANDILYRDAAEPVQLPLDAFTCKTISNPRPALPLQAARGGRFDGGVTIRVAVVVDEAGKVVSARMVSGDPLLKKSSEEAALKAQFRPTVVGGRTVKVAGEILHSFQTRTTMVMVGPVPARW